MVLEVDVTIDRAGIAGELVRCSFWRQGERIYGDIAHSINGYYAIQYN